jgi:hypothetical protein
MYRFTAEGHRLANSPCIMTGAKHEPEPAAASVGTFLCKRCGAIPKDSDDYLEDVRHPDAYDPYDPYADDPREDDRGLPRLRR